MIEPLEYLPAGVIGFRAVGTVEASDYRDVLDPAIDAAVAGPDSVNLVFVMGDEFDHVSFPAMLEDAKLIRVPHEAWGRAAFVTNHDVLGAVATAFGGLVPGEFRVFPLEKQGEAVAWVAEGARLHTR
ncbi:STAS/SEC14 domain-containing protein [Agromyces sp. SYSU K20354]|uniref:STAS/SEC14 domain-containing protein n=1 Tax=Agromyces cavernae TaxID=2898659 RepID=UPI001E3F248C|nr:STAS/SEC14 domain-containing protein [Agromyces cavernae]MCD2441326.1 STAS/SEC14 domain-containing protein [Agromyces cavernae]